MPLVVICGQPCSGKSSVANKIADVCRQRGHEVIVVDEQSLHLTRDASYRDVPSEKNTRGALRSETNRVLSRSRVVIFDSLNNIKGYRYELWCLARSAATRYCMVHVDSSVETCRQWNSTREGDSYCSEVFEDLASRFERPDARNRWDAPLFTVRPEMGDVHIAEQVEAVAVAATETSASAATAAAVAAGASAAGPTGRNLKPTCATERNHLSSTNLLHDIDRATQDVLDKVAEAQAAAGAGAPGIIQYGGDLPTLHLQRQVSVSELRKHKRMFLRLTTSNGFNRLTDSGQAARLFINYLRDQTLLGS